MPGQWKIVEPDRPEGSYTIDGHEGQFVECGTCAVKPGSPALCPSCLHNRALVGTLETQFDGLRRENERLRRLASAATAILMEMK